MTRIRWGFKSKTQLPLFMIWREYLDGPAEGEVVHAVVLFDSMDWIGI